MNDTEKTARILRTIAYLLCAILLMEVILFAGITAFASVENYFIPSEAHLNQRINSSGALAPISGGYFTTNIFYVPSDTEYIYIKGIDVVSLDPWYFMGNVRVGFGDTDSFPLGNARYLSNVNTMQAYGISLVEGTTDVTRISTVYSSDRDLRGKYVALTLAIPDVSSVSMSDVENIMINFSGVFEESTYNKSIFGLYSDFTQGIPNIITNLANSLYNENGLTTIGTSLCIIGGFGTVCAIIKIILKSLQGGK